jgi:transposase-like protein
MGTGKGQIPQKELLFMASASSAIANLRSQRPDLHDLDRAKAVRDIRRSGVSIRKLALQLPVSESSLRHLLKAAKLRPKTGFLPPKAKSVRTSSFAAPMPPRLAVQSRNARLWKANVRRHLSWAARPFAIGCAPKEFWGRMANRSYAKLNGNWPLQKRPTDFRVTPRHRACEQLRLFSDAGLLNSRTTTSVLS